MHPTIASPFPENAPGKFYVTSDCNGCGLCFMHALQNMMYCNDASYYFIYNQPEDERETADLAKAMEVCPMNCIHNDGFVS